MSFKNLSFNERDEFKRKNIALKVISLLQADIDISPMVIDGGWGTGKTEFCHKLINLMQGNDTHHLIYIDAFKADHADEPLMTVLAEVIKVLPDDGSKQSFMKKALPAVRYGLKTIAKAGASHILKQDVADVAGDFDKEIQKAADKAIDATVESVLKDHVNADKTLKALQTALSDIAATKPIILFVDELDRCRPNFAVDMLEIIKHTFDVEGVSFVLITNTQQLKASVNHCYGHAVDARRYLDKFVKYTVTLPETVDIRGHRDTIAAVEHYKNLVRVSKVLAHLRLFEDGSIRIIETLIIVNHLSLREVETIVRHLEIYVILKPDEYLTPTTVFGYKLFTILAIAIYSIDLDLAQSIIKKKLDAKKLGDLLGVSSLPKETSGHFGEEELICYLLGSTAPINSEYFTPSEEATEAWLEQSKCFSRGSFTISQSDFTSLFREVTHAVTMC